MTKLLGYRNMYKNVLIALLSCCLVPTVYAQSAFKLVKALKNSKITKAAVVCRTTKASTAQTALVKEVIQLHNPEYTEILSSACLPEIQLKAEFKIPLLRRPETLYGSYSYLKILASWSKDKGAVDPKFVGIWKNIHKTQTYNGVHHIVNKSTLKAIHSDMKLESRIKGTSFNINLAQLQNTAPATFHVLHGNPAYKQIFHDTDLQYKTYKSSGVKGIIDIYFKQINKVNTSLGLKPVPLSVIVGTFKEAELWAKTFNLRWE